MVGAVPWFDGRQPPGRRSPRAWVGLLVAIGVAGGVRLQAAAGGVGYPGRFSTLREVNAGQPAEAVNSACTLIVERVLKVHALVARRDGNTYGARACAGSFSVRPAGGPWAFTLPETARQNRVEWPSPFAARVVQSVTVEGGWTAEVAADLVTDYPAVWFSARRTSGTDALAGGLLGHSWAERTTAADWIVDGRQVQRVAGETTQFADSATGPVRTLVCRDPAGFTGVLQATAVYAVQAVPDYPKVHWPILETHFRQLRAFMDGNGIALASPGPGYWHVIAESGIGGYLAWHGLYHLSRLAGEPAYAEEARARGAYAWRAWQTLCRWRPEFGEPAAVVNGVCRGLVETLSEPAWAYVQSTYFTHLAGFVLAPDDRMGLWRSLEAQPWWEWTARLGFAR